MASNQADCAICLEPPTNPAMTPCTHVFCRRCIGPWLDNHSACPICRHRITRGRRALVTVRGVSSPARRAASAPNRPSPPAVAAPAAPARPSGNGIPHLRIIFCWDLIAVAPFFFYGAVT